MSKLNKYLNRGFRTSFAALTLLTMSQAATAQDQFQVKIKLTPEASAEVNYETMEKQATKFCKREAGRTEDRLTPIKYKYAFINKCIYEVMDKTMKQIQDPDLLVLHNSKTSDPIILTNRDTNPQN